MNDYPAKLIAQMSEERSLESARHQKEIIELKQVIKELEAKLEKCRDVRYGHNTYVHIDSPTGGTTCKLGGK